MSTVAGEQEYITIELNLREGAYPLGRTWSIWAFGANSAKRVRGRKPEKPEPADPTCFGKFGCIVTLWQYLHSLPPPSRMGKDSTFYIFEEGISPLWEDEQNKNGGRWMFTISDELTDEEIDKLWQLLLLMLTGETLDPEREVTGILISIRKNYTRISVWTKDRENSEYLNQLGQRIKKIIPQTVRLEYQDHGAAYNQYRHLI